MLLCCSLNFFFFGQFRDRSHMHARCDGDAGRPGHTTSCRPRRKQSARGIVQKLNSFATWRVSKHRERASVCHDRGRGKKNAIRQRTPVQSRDNPRSRMLQATWLPGCLRGFLRLAIGWLTRVSLCYLLICLLLACLLARLCRYVLNSFCHLACSKSSPYA